MTAQPPIDHAESSSSAPHESIDQLDGPQDGHAQKASRLGFVTVRGVDHYALEVDGSIWRSETAAEMLYAHNRRSDTLVKAGPTVADTFRVGWVPIELSSTRYGRSINLTHFRRRNR